MVSFGILRRVALVRSEVSDEPHGVTSQKTSFFILVGDINAKARKKAF
jgi:hypothetical protein